MINIIVIIPSFNRSPVTKKAVLGLLNQTTIPDRVIVCDSDSDDGTREGVLVNDSVEVVHLSKNDWWSRAINVGIKNALKYDPKYILILNDDIEFDSNLVADFISESLKNENLILAPAQESFYGYYRGINFSKYLKIPYHINNIIDDFNFADFTNGCCLFFSANILNRIGPIDNGKFPHLSGDLYWQLTAKKLGYKTLVISKILVKQIEQTNYFPHSIKSAFLNQKSNLNFRNYINTGILHFDNLFKFLLFGIYYHLRYVKLLFIFLIKRVKSE